MYSRTNLRYFLILFFVVGLLPLYGAWNADLDNSIFKIILMRHVVSGVSSILLVTLFLHLTKNETSPFWLTAIGTLSIFNFVSFMSYLLGPFFLAGFVFLGLASGLKFYELDLKESMFMGLVFIISYYLGVIGSYLAI